MENTASKPKKSKFKTFLYETFSYPLHLISHPIGEWEEFKKNNKSKLWVALFYLGMFCFAVVFNIVASGYLVNQNDINKFNLLQTLSLVIFPVIIATVGNWCITALLDGKGRMIDIFKMICYSFFPVTWLLIIATIISNFITLDEATYYTFLISAGTFVTGYMMFFGFRGIHEFGLFKTILTILFTIVAVAIILFVCLLFLSLVQQMYGWVYSIIREIRVRFF